MVAEHGHEVHPSMTQLGRRLACPVPLAMEKPVPIEHCVPSQHVIDRSCQFLGEDGSGLAGAVFFLGITKRLHPMKEGGRKRKGNDERHKKTRIRHDMPSSTGLEDRCG